MQALMQDYPLALPHIFHRAERLFPAKEIVTPRRSRAGGANSAAANSGRATHDHPPGAG